MNNVVVLGSNGSSRGGNVKTLNGQEKDSEEENSEAHIDLTFLFVSQASLG